MYALQLKVDRSGPALISCRQAQLRHRSHQESARATAMKSHAHRNLQKGGKRKRTALFAGYS